MLYLIDQLKNGIVLGSIYGLIAIGYTMVYGIIGMINFAHGDIFMISGFLALIGYLVFSALGMESLPLILICVLMFSMAFTGAYGWTIERLAYRPLRGSFRLAPLITAIGMSLFLQNYVQVFQGARNNAIPSLFPPSLTLIETESYSVSISYAEILILIVTAIVLTLFTLLIQRTSLGRAQRACEQDRGMAALCGVNVDRTIALTFIMGAALAAVAGMMHILRYGTIDFFEGFVVGIKAFTAAVLGGIGSLPGAMLGGLMLGLIEVLWSGYVNVEYKDVAAFSILAIILIFRPQGLLGKPEVEKV